ncbi:MAG: 3-phosphoshikimate 1-carboxyvinyltransferase, partial [Candidatus Bathyarchaeia archaeon]
IFLTAPEALRSSGKTINCGDSASTLRFMTAVAALAQGRTVLTGNPGLLKRPVGPLVRALRDLEVPCADEKGYPPIIIDGGGIRGGKTRLPGDVSSQFITALLLAGPLAQGETTLDVTSPLESKPYVDLTLDIVKKHEIAIHVSESSDHFNIPAPQQYTQCNHSVPGDFSSAAFLLAAAAVTNSRLKVTNLPVENRKAPDHGILRVLEKMGITLRIGEGSVEVLSSELHGDEIEASDMPDLVPVTAAIASVAEGETRILKASRLRLKESDRLSALSVELKKLGATITEYPDALHIRGVKSLKGSTVDPHNDHRIAMAAAVAALRADGPTRIINAECVRKSYPTFADDLRRIGVEVQVAR